MLNNRLKEVRNILNKSAIEVAEENGLKRSTYYSYESGAAVPPVDVIEALANKYNFNSHWLITGQGSMFVEQKNTLQLKEPELLTMDKYALGRRVNKIMAESGLHSIQMCEIIDIKERDLAQLIMGEYKLTPDFLMNLVYKICENFDVTADWLLFGKE